MKPELEEVKKAAASARRSKARLEEAIKVARRAKATWTEIGEVLSVSRQGAWKRYRKVDEEEGAA